MALTSRSNAFTFLVNADPNTGLGVSAPVGYQARNTSTGTLWQKTGVGNTAWTQLAFTGTGGDPFWTGRITTGRRLSNACATSLTTGVFPANDLRAYPFIYPGGGSYSAAAIEITTAVAGSNQRFGIYEDSNGLPGNLLIDFGTVSSGTIGIKQVVTPFTLTAGKYWFAAIGDNGAVNNRNVNFINGFGLYGHDLTGTSTYGFWRVPQAFGALPGTFPGGGNLQAGGCFAMWVYN